MVSRFREELAGGRSTTREAVVRTMATAGRTVAVSGLTVTLALAGLLLFPQVFLRSMGYGAMAAVAVAMLASLTVLPAALALLGDRINALPGAAAARRPPSGPRRAPRPDAGRRRLGAARPQRHAAPLAVPGRRAGRAGRAGRPGDAHPVRWPGHAGAAGTARRAGSSTTRSHADFPATTRRRCRFWSPAPTRRSQGRHRPGSPRCPASPARGGRGPRRPTLSSRSTTRACRPGLAAHDAVTGDPGTANRRPARGSG